MNERKDRLAGMVGGAAPEPAGRPGPARRALLYAPAPTPPAPWLALLQQEGLEVLVATSPEAASALLDGAGASLIVVLAPVMGEALREVFRKKAPGAEVRVVPGLGALLDASVLSPRDTADFAARVAATLAGLAAGARGLPRDRPRRVAQWTGAARLGLSWEQAWAARVMAALHEVPDALAVSAGAEATVRAPAEQWEALSELLRGLGAPFAVERPSGSRAGRPPAAVDVVEAALEYEQLVGRGAKQPALELRKRAAADALHPAAVEAVIKAVSGESERRRPRVLLADGDAAARGLLALRLENEGHTVEAVADGRAALEAVRARPPALVLAETVLPGLDGFALLDTLKREGRGGIPFVFLSSRADALAVNKGLILGAADFLPKPVNAEVLLTKIEKLLGQSLAPAEASSRLSLADLERGSAADHPQVGYDELAPGVCILGRFRIVADLGEGGMGKVFKAHDERLEEDVVVKVMKDALTADQRVLELFKREIRLARKISHPAVVRIYDFWEAGPLKYVTMEFLEGTDLRHEMKRRGAFPPPVALRLATELFEGLAAAHELGVIHRDIKPHNVLLLKGGHIKILDFGLAHGLDPTTRDARTLTATPMGTPEYMSPEQLLGERLDPRTDLYSAGVVFFELLTGRLPFVGTDRMAVATQRLHVAPPLPSTLATGVPAGLDSVIVRLLARERDQRYPAAQAVLADLAALRPLA